MAGRQQDGRPQRHGPTPWLQAGRLACPTTNWPPSLPPRKKKRRKKVRDRPRLSLHSIRWLRGNPPVAAQSPPFSPGKAKLSCSTSNRGLKDKHTRLLTHATLGQGRGRGQVGVAEEKESSMQPAPGEQPLPPRQQDGRASGLPQGAAWRPQASTCQQGLPGRQRPRAVTRPDDRGSRWPGRWRAESHRGHRSRETDRPHLQGGLGVWRATSPPWVQRCCLSPCLQGGCTLRAARGATGQKAKKSAKTQPCLQGGRPAQTSHALP